MHNVHYMEINESAARLMKVLVLSFVVITTAECYNKANWFHQSMTLSKNKSINQSINKHKSPNDPIIQIYPWQWAKSFRIHHDHLIMSNVFSFDKKEQKTPYSLFHCRKQSKAFLFVCFILYVNIRLDVSGYYLICIQTTSIKLLQSKIKC